MIENLWMSLDFLANWRFRTPVILPLVAALLVSYFAFYTFFGERSLLRLMQLDRQVASASAHLSGIKSEHDALEAKVQHMRPESIDPDLLDQQVRSVLNYTAPGEVVIMTKADTAPAPSDVIAKSIQAHTVQN